MVNVISSVGIGALKTRFRLILATSKATGPPNETTNDAQVFFDWFKGQLLFRRVGVEDVTRGFLTLRVPYGWASS